MQQQLNLGMTTVFMQQQPKIVANLLETQSAEHVATFFNLLPLDDTLQTLRYMLPNYITRLAPHMSQRILIDLLTRLDASMTTAILRQLDLKIRQHIVESLPKKHRAACQLMLSFRPELVGAWMQAKPLLLPDICDVKEALLRIKNSDDEFLSDPLFIANRDRHVLGRISVFKLLTASDNMPLSSLMATAPTPISGRVPLDSVKDNVEWQSEHVIPVVNQANQVIGILEYATMLAGIQQHLTMVPNEKAKPIRAVLESYNQLLKTLTRGIVKLKFNETNKEDDH